MFAFPGILAHAQNLQEFEKKVTEFTLPNGLRFVVVERHEAPVVAFNATVNAGSVDDPAGASSMAHMFEHMIGKGTTSLGTTNWPEEQKALAEIEQRYDALDAERNKGDRADKAKVQQLEAALTAAVERANKYVDPNAYTRVISENGGAGFNAGTAQDYTTYFYSLPANRAELWFLLQSEWLRRPVFREFYKERDVVREERRMRVESDVQGKLQELLLATAFMEHPYRDLIGWAGEIERLRAKDAEAFFRKYYVPGNIVIAIVGDVDARNMRALADKYFASIPPGPMPPPVAIVEPLQEGPKSAALETETQPIVFIGYKRPSQRDPDDPVLDVVNGVIASGRTGLLYRRLVRDQKIALEADAADSLPGGKYPNLFLIFAAPNSGHTVEENEKAIYAILDELKQKPVDEETLKRVKTKIRAGLIRQLDSNSGLAAQITFYQIAYGDWRMMFKGLEEINKVTAADVQRVVKKYFTEQGRTVVYTMAPPAAVSAKKESGQ